MTTKCDAETYNYVIQLQHKQMVLKWPVRAYNEAYDGLRGVYRGKLHISKNRKWRIKQCNNAQVSRM